MTIMKMTKLALVLSTCCISGTLFAQQDSAQRTQPAYGDNPNLIKVLTVKAQQKVQSTAEKVGAAAERGVAKIKPNVDNTWQNTKEYTSEQAVIARDNTRQGIDQAVQKVKQTKDNIMGTGGVPIERGSLSQSNNQQVQNANQPMQTLPQPVTLNSNTNALETQPVIQTTQPAHSDLASNPVSPQHQPEFSESEIKRQSIPIQNSAGDAAINPQSTTAPAEPSLVQPKNSQDELNDGIPQ